MRAQESTGESRRRGTGESIGESNPRWISLMISSIDAGLVQYFTYWYSVFTYSDKQYSPEPNAIVHIYQYSQSAVL